MSRRLVALVAAQERRAGQRPGAVAVGDLVQRPVQVRPPRG